MEKIRVFMGMLGMDQHEVGAIAVSRMPVWRLSMPEGSICHP